MSRLAGKVALVTGGGSGLGRAVAQRFAAEGARVVVADIDAARAEAVAKDIGGNAAAIACDHTSSEQNKRAVAFALEQFGALDIVHNNAGGPFTGAFEDADDATMERVLRTNLFGVMQMTRAALPHLRASAKTNPAGSSLLFTSSLQGLKAKRRISVFIPSQSTALSAWCAASRSNSPPTMCAPMPYVRRWLRLRCSKPSCPAWRRSLRKR